MECQMQTIQLPKHEKDMIQKDLFHVFKDDALKYFGITVPKVMETINVELRHNQFGEKRPDLVFLLEDDSFLHLEFQSSYSKNDAVRFVIYDALLYEQRGQRKITTVVLYSANVKKASVHLNLGSLTYAPHKIMMCDYNGDKTFEELSEKINHHEEVSDTDMIKLATLPLMKYSKTKEPVAAMQALKLATQIDDPLKRRLGLVGVYSTAGNVLKEEEMNKLSEVLQMTDVFEKLIRKTTQEAHEKGLKEGIEEGIEKGIEQGIEQEKIETAQKMLAKQMDIQLVAEVTGLDVSIVKELQTN